MHLNISPIYGIVRSFCIAPFGDDSNCTANEDAPYAQPLYNFLAAILVMFILYTLIFEKELRFLKRLTLANIAITIVSALLFLTLWVILK